MKQTDLILSPLLIPAYPPFDGETVYVVADVLRASASIIAAFENGARAVYPLETVAEAEEKARLGYLVGAERNAEKLPFAHLGNDPFEYTREAVENREIYFTTTNGTRTIKACFRANPGAAVVIGSFPNLSAVARFCLDKSVYVVAAGWKGKVSLEDALFGAALFDRLRATHAPASDALRMIAPLYDPRQVVERVKSADHYARLVRTGKTASFVHCLTPDTADLLPIARLTDDQIRISL